MKANWIAPVALGLALAGSFSVSAFAQEDPGAEQKGESKRETVSIDKVPDAAKNTIMAQSKGGTVEKVEKAVRDGKTVYFADIMVNGRRERIEVDEAGKLLKTERGGAQRPGGGAQPGTR